MTSMVGETDFGFLRRRIKDRASLGMFEEIKGDWHKTRKEGKIVKGRRLFGIRIGRHRFWMRKDGASSSVDTYLEIFKNKGHMKIPQFSGKGDHVVFDIGANEGFYTVGIKDNNPNLKIISVEPVPSTFRILAKNVKANGLKDVIMVNKAVTSRNGKLTFEIIPEVTAVCGFDIAMQKRKWLDNKRIKRIKVNAITLADLCKRLGVEQIDILKLDVEGSELEILKSSKDILGNIRKVVLEYHTEKLKEGCKAFLGKNGFKLVYEDAGMGRCGDLYFINRMEKKRIPYLGLKKVRRVVR